MPSSRPAGSRSQSTERESPDVASASPDRELDPAAALARLHATAGNAAVARLLTGEVEARDRLATIRAELGRPGKDLDPETRAQMQSELGRELPRVRVHDDAGAARAARAANATAFTHGGEIVLGAGAPPLSSSDGRRVLAHELVHVLQQAPSPPRSLGLVPPGAAAEQQAQGASAPAAPAAAGGVARLVEKNLTRLSETELAAEYQLVQRYLADHPPGPDYDAGAAYVLEIEREMASRTTTASPAAAKPSAGGVSAPTASAAGVPLAALGSLRTVAGTGQMTALEAGEAGLLGTPGQVTTAANSVLTGGQGYSATALPSATQTGAVAASETGGLAAGEAGAVAAGEAGALTTAAEAGGLATAGEVGALGTGAVVESVVVGGTALGSGTVVSASGAVVSGTVVAEGTAVVGTTVIAGGAEVVAVTGATTAVATGGGVGVATGAAAGSSVVPVIGWIVAGVIVAGVVVYLVTRDPPYQAPGAPGRGPVTEPEVAPPMSLPRRDPEPEPYAEPDVNRTIALFPGHGPGGAVLASGPLDGERHYKVYRRNGDEITDIDYIEGDTLWELKSAVSAGDIAEWIKEQITEKFEAYLEARPRLPPFYSDAHIGFWFEYPLNDIDFATALWEEIGRLQAEHPDVKIELIIPPG